MCINAGIIFTHNQINARINDSGDAGTAEYLTYKEKDFKIMVVI